jgi:hypothetical protein
MKSFEAHDIEGPRLPEYQSLGQSGQQDNMTNSVLGSRGSSNTAVNPLKNDVSSHTICPVTLFLGEYEFSNSTLHRGFTDNGKSWAGRAQKWIFELFNLAMGLRDGDEHGV